MNNLNSIILEGEILADAEPKESLHGIYTEFTIGVKRFYKNAAGEEVEEESRFEVQAFGSVAGMLTRDNSKWGKKGQGVRIVGRLKQERYECDGRKCAKVVLIAEHIEFRPRVVKVKAAE